LLTLNSASNRSVPISGLPVKKILSVVLLSRNVKRSADLTKTVGNFVLDKKEISLLLMLPNVLPLIIALDQSSVLLNNRPLSDLLTLNSASNKNVPISGLPVKKILSVVLLSRNVKRSAELTKTAGSFVLDKKETSLLSMLPNVLPLITALELLNLTFKLLLLLLLTPTTALLKNAPTNGLLALRILNVLLLFKTANKDARPIKIAGTLASLLKEVNLPLIYSSAQLPISAFKRH